jgi:hypothetical protein
MKDACANIAGNLGIFAIKKVTQPIATFETWMPTATVPLARMETSGSKVRLSRYGTSLTISAHAVFIDYKPYLPPILHCVQHSFTTVSRHPEASSSSVRLFDVFCGASCQQRTSLCVEQDRVPVLLVVIIALNAICKASR